MAQTFSATELAKFDGKGGNPTYVALKGIVYDVSLSSLWDSGEHLDGHLAGRDLTNELLDAPHGEEAFAGFPVVGELK
ncbi:MAG: cytochrome B5 [Chloroflexi bacterium]|nr:cytochrome B5 [Chloroflexota bacterium]